MITFRLPYPPSVNHYWRKKQGQQKNYISAEGKQYRQEVWLVSKKERLPSMTGRLSISIVIYPPDQRERDGSNLWKCLLDSLVECRVLPGDSNRYLRRESLEWAEQVDKVGHVVVTIKEYESAA